MKVLSGHENETEKPDKRKTFSLLKKVFSSSNSLKCKFFSWHLSLMNCLSRTSFFDPIRGYTVFIKQMNSSYFTYFFPLNSTFALKWIIFPKDSITNQFVVDHNTFFFFFWVLVHFLDLEIYEKRIHQCGELESAV